MSIIANSEREEQVLWKHYNPSPWRKGRAGPLNTSHPVSKNKGKSGQFDTSHPVCTEKGKSRSSEHFSTYLYREREEWVIWTLLDGQISCYIELLVKHGGVPWIEYIELLLQALSILDCSNGIQDLLRAIFSRFGGNQIHTQDTYFSSPKPLYPFFFGTLLHVDCLAKTNLNFKYIMQFFLLMF